MRTVPVQQVNRWALDKRLLTLASEIFGFRDIVRNLGTASTAWPSAERAIAIPFRTNGMVVDQLGWVNGSGAGSNHDIGIYRSDFTRVVSSGTTVGAGNSLWQFVDVTDTPLGPGLYYLVKAVDATTASRVNLIQHTASSPLLDLMGVKDSSSDNFVLPDPLVGMGTPSVFTRLPSLGIVARDPFV